MGWLIIPVALVAWLIISSLFKKEGETLRCEESPAPEPIPETPVVATQEKTEPKKPSIDAQISAAGGEPGLSSSHSKSSPDSRYPGGRDHPTYKSSHKQERE